jgi:hypothetical protein
MTRESITKESIQEAMDTHGISRKDVRMRLEREKDGDIFTLTVMGLTDEVLVERKYDYKDLSDFVPNRLPTYDTLLSAAMAYFGRTDREGIVVCIGDSATPNNTRGSFWLNAPGYEGPLSPNEEEFPESRASEVVTLFDLPHTQYTRMFDEQAHITVGKVNEE